jgi:acetolactate synthase-1/2/3 large subunit
MYTTSTAFLEALAECGVAFLFSNFGSDHPPILEALAEARAEGRHLPRVITCPNEMVALSAAHGYAQATGQAQAVLVHVECGTQSLGGAVHNASRARIPVLIFAGLSPVTQEGELTGSRTEFIHWLQDVHDQRGIVREYMKYDNEIRTGANVKQIVHRAMQIAHAEPRGPVYLVGSREAMEAQAPQRKPGRDFARPGASVLPEDAVAELARELLNARRPLIVTSYLGRDPEAVNSLVTLADRAAIGVLEAVPNCVNFPAAHSLHQGYQGNEPRQNAALAQADFILVLDCDVPWMPAVNRPAPNARIWHIDVDPLKERFELWHIDAERVFSANSAATLEQLNRYMMNVPEDARLLERRTYYVDAHKTRLRELAGRERPDGDIITPEFLTARVREHIARDAVVLNEGITNYSAILNHIGDRPAGTMFTSGGGSLGWNGGAAIGFKLARPEAEVVCLAGDGSYLFSAPSSVHWIARRYRTPFLQIVFNNGGWRSPKLSALTLHPDGFVARAHDQGEDIGVAFDRPPDYSGIAAAAGGAFAHKVQRADDLDAALAAALHAVRSEKRCAVLDVLIPHL